MILSELLGSDAFDDEGRRVGAVVDVRREISGAPPQLLAETVLTGLLVSPRSRLSTWGYERGGANGPALIAHLQRWLHRGMFLVAWSDVARIDERRVELRRGYTAHDPWLPGAPRSR